MPRMDGTGPQGKGQRGGRGLGPCGQRNQANLDDAFPQGGRKRFSDQSTLSTPADEIAALKDEIAALRGRLEATEAELSEMEKR